MPTFRKKKEGTAREVLSAGNLTYTEADLDLPSSLFVPRQTLILLIPILYIELRWQHDLSWVSNTLTAYSVLW